MIFKFIYVFINLSESKSQEIFWGGKFSFTLLGKTRLLKKRLPATKPEEDQQH
jgi:hypothetical protein